MTDGQTTLMQQAADPSWYDHPSERTTVSGGPVFISARHPRAARDRRPAPEANPRASVTHIRQLLQAGADQPAVRELVALLLRGASQRQVESYLDSLLTRGFPAEHIYLRVLQPAARHLGALWLDDICTFVDVTLATGALQSGMRYLAPRFHQHGRPARGMRSVVLGTLGGDQHTFGLAMTAEFFRRSGWTVFSTTSGQADDLIERLRGESNAVVGYSVSRADQLPALSAAIRQVRLLGRDRVAGIVVGGPLFATHPELVHETGADAVGLDARQALAEAETLAAAGDCG